MLPPIAGVGGWQRHSPLRHLGLDPGSMPDTKTMCAGQDGFRYRGHAPRIACVRSRKSRSISWKRSRAATPSFILSLSDMEIRRIDCLLKRAPVHEEIGAEMAWLRTVGRYKDAASLVDMLVHRRGICYHYDARQSDIASRILWPQPSDREGQRWTPHAFCSCRSS